MKIFGLEIKRIEKKYNPKKDFSYGCNITEKGKEYLLGLKDSPFSQGYLNYDGLGIANNRICFIWKDEVVMSKSIIGGYTGMPLYIYGIFGKTKVTLT